MAKINNIIFDLGKVIVEINHEKTIRHLEQVSHVSSDEIKLIFQEELIRTFELGKISEKEFFSRVAHILLLDDRDDHDVILNAWNSMIIGIPQQSINLLQEVKENFQIFALSNTNSTHMKVVNAILYEKYGIADMRELFHKVYYSFEVGLEKPDQDIFEHVLEDLRLLPSNTLFIDDNHDNIRTADLMGFHTLHLLRQEDLTAKLKKLGLLKKHE